MCLGDYYEQTFMFTQSLKVKKYLLYLNSFIQWENHARSLELEAVTLGNINKRIQEKVMKNEGTWIDWQYLLDAAALLAKVSYI